MCLLREAVEDGAINPRHRHDSGKAGCGSSCSVEDVVGNTGTNNHASTTVTNALIPSKPQLVHGNKKTTFEERGCNQLLRFKEEFGHCIVPNNYSDNTSLGHWCKSMRHAYNRTQKGLETRGVNLQPYRIEQLEEIGFKWHAHDASFHKRCHELMAFRKEFGHCNVPRTYQDIPSFGIWCDSMSYAYRRLQKGKKIRSNLSQDRIKRLEEIGFKW